MENKLVVYLAGPMAGCSDSESIDWREDMKSSFPQVVFLDPMRRDYRNIRTDIELATKIVEDDKSDIEASNYVFVNAWKNSVGTSMEIYHAFNEGVVSIVIVPDRKTCSPWIIYHADYIFDSMDSAKEFLRLQI